ncbi:MAG: cytochrome c [Gammaproteobacteria bacterium]|nr:cytochrome c [Gammaproteobacteria bacterium]
MNKKTRKLTSLGFGLLAALALSSQARADEVGSFDREIEYRQSVMTLYNWNMKPMGAMIKGKRPFDAAVFARHAKDLSAVAGLDLLSGFPEDSEDGETDALADIWLDFDDFQQKYADLQEASRALNQVAASSDQAEIKAAFGKVGKTCKACHKAYKN